MKIKRKPIKTLPSLHPELSEIVSHLEQDSPISTWKLTEWQYPKSDFFQFITVLNRFDKVLENICKEYELALHIQDKHFDATTKQTLLSILNTTRLLFENCSNRSLYNSYDHLNLLLYTTDIDVLEATLELLLIPAQRINNPAAAHSNFSIEDDKVTTELAKNGDIAFLYSTETQCENKISMSFYKEEGSELEMIDMVISGTETDQQIFWEIATKHQVPKEYHFELLNKIRLANHSNRISTRRQLLKIRLMSIAILANTMFETTIQNRLYIYEPNLVTQIVQLVSCEDHYPTDIQTYALYALDAIARHDFKLTEVLNSLNAAANHGLLIQTLRQLSNDSSKEYQPSFFNAFFTLLSYLTDTDVGGQMLASAGIVHTSVSMIDNEKIDPRVLAKVISLLDVALNSVESSYPIFFHSNGLNACIKALKTQVNTCIENPHHHDSIMLVKTILRFINRMVKSSHAGTTLRNLMETSIPYILTKVMDHYKLLGSTVLSLALNLFARYIHMEPTSLTVLQELQVPQTFLKMFKNYQGHYDVTLLLNMMDAFGAACLNEQGLIMFQEAQPLPHFFKLLSSIQFLKNPIDVHETTEIGAGMNELTRHQPLLKPKIFSCIHTMLQEVIILGQSKEPEDGSHQLVTGKAPVPGKTENHLLSMIEMVSRFLEGFLEFDSIKEFLSYKGHEILLRYYSLPMLPFDYYLSNAFGSLSDVFRELADKQTIVISESIINEVKKSASVLIKPDPSLKSSVADYIYVDGTNEELLKEGNRVLREYSFLVGRVGLLSSTLSLLVLQKDESCGEFIDWLFIQGAENLHSKEGGFFELLGSIHRTLIWEIVLLRNAVPRSWFSKIVKHGSDGKIEEVENADLTDPKVINTRRFAELLTGVSPVVMPLLQSIIKLEPYSHRKPSKEEGYQWFLVSQDIAKAIVKNFQWIKDTFDNRQEYIAAVSAMFSMLILDDKEKRQLVSLVAVWFAAKGGIRWIVDNLINPYTSQVDRMIHEGQDKTPAFEQTNGCLELLYPVLLHLALSNLYSDVVLNDIASRDKKLEILYPGNWLLFVRADILKVKSVISLEHFAEFPKHTIRAVLGCIKECMYMHGERFTNTVHVIPLGTEDELEVQEKYLEELVDTIKRTPSPSTRTRRTVVENTSDIPEDDQDEEYEDVNEDDPNEDDLNGPFFSIADCVLYSSRNYIRSKLPEVLTRLVQNREDLDFIVRDTLIALVCGSPTDYGNNQKIMGEFFQGLNAQGGDTLSRFGSCIHRVRIFALMLREPLVQHFAIDWVSAISEYVNWFEFLDLMIAQPDFPNPKWLTTLFLILETYIAHVENQVDGLGELYFSNSKASDLMQRCVRLLSMNTLSEDNLLATLRVLIRLTRRTQIASEFLQNNGLQALLTRPRSHFDLSVRIQQAYVIIILRHLIESKQVLENYMTKWLLFYLAKHRHGETHFAKLLRAAQPLFLRDPVSFTSSYEYSYRLKGKEMDMRFERAKDDLAINTIDSKTVIHFLLNELVTTQSTREENNWKLGYTGYLIECILELVSSYPSCKQDVISFKIPEKVQIHYTQDVVPHSDGSVLSMLLNILVTFGPLNARTNKERKMKGIYIWTTGLLVALCYDTTHAVNEKTAEDQSSDSELDEAIRSKSFDPEQEEKEQSEMLKSVRIQVLQNIARHFDYYTKAKTKSTRRYIKYYSLSELCHHILNARPAAINPDYVPPSNLKEANVMALSKLMIDNNFVPLLIAAVRDVDVNYPHAKTILNALLRPLEKLTKMATRFEQDQMNEAEQEEVKREYFDMFHARRSASPVEEVEELYRNSSMAILDGTAVEEEDEDSSDENDQEVHLASSGEEDFDIENDEISFDEELYNDDSMSEHDDEEGDQDDREMDELMRSHRHNLPDTDEEDSSSLDESSDEDEGDSSDSFDVEDDSEVFNSDMSDHVEPEEEEEEERGWDTERRRQRSAPSSLYMSENDETEEEEPVDGVRGYDLAVRRRLAGGSSNMVVVNHHSNTIHMPSVTMSFGAKHDINIRPGEISSDRDDIILHPLLRNSVDHSTSEIKEALTGETSMAHLQPYEDIIGHGALLMLQSAVSSQGRQDNNTNMEQEVSGASPFVSEGTTLAIPNEEENAMTNEEDKIVLRLLLEFAPAPTLDRWNQVSQMALIRQTAAMKAAEIADDMAIVGSPKNVDRLGMDNDIFTLPFSSPEQSQENEPEEIDTDRSRDGISVVIRSQGMELRGSGIDAEFLDALPEDLRDEVRNAQRDGYEPVLEFSAEDGLDPEFLAALPDDVREEVLREEEAIDRRRRQGSEEQEETRSQSEENSQVADDEEEESQSVTEEQNRHTPDPEIYEQDYDPTQGVLPPIAAQSFNVIRIIDRSQLAILTRLLFVPQSIVKALLNRLLLNLCKNTQTCTDLISLLLCVLQDECPDLSAVDRSFALLFNEASVTEEKKTNGSANTTSNLISQRCLEILYYVVQWNWQSLVYFLSEVEQFRHVHNGKHKYPFLALIDLLKRPSFISNSKLTEQLTELLAKISRPIWSLIEQYSERSDQEEGWKHPVQITSNYFERIVRVLTTNECSSHTFRFTLSILSNLSHLDGGFDEIINCLKSVAAQSISQIFKDLEIVLSILDKTEIRNKMESTALRQFSTATSHQMRLLRVLNTMRFLCSRRYKREGDQGKKEGKKVDSKIDTSIYDDLHLVPLWNILGSCLSIIRDKADLVDVATVLLPLVECFMTLSKDYLNADPSTTENAFFVRFTDEHKKILNTMVRNNPHLMKGSFSCLVNVPMILDFDNKRFYFTEALHEACNSAQRFPVLQLGVRREYTFEDTYEQLQDLTGDEVRYGKLKVQFHDEEGIDEGGVSREWFSTLARQMFDPNYALFITSAADKLTYLPNRASGINPDHLLYFKFVGRIIGKAIHDDRLLDAYFTRSFYKLILGRHVDYKDLEAVDPTYYKSIVWMLENDITNVIDLTFSMETDDFGTTKIIDLKPDGRNIPVTEANKHEYVNLIASQRLEIAIKPQVDAFLEGFYEIIPDTLINIFNEQELELLISGLPDIDVDDWISNTEYEGYTYQSTQIQWFWRAVRSFDGEERAKLLQFATGTSKVPLGGFSALQGSNGLQKFQIHKEFSSTNRLPSAHTCFNQVDLPQYQSYDDLRRNLFKAISECSTGFGLV